MNTKAVSKSAKGAVAKRAMPVTKTKCRSGFEALELDAKLAAASGPWLSPVGTWMAGKPDQG